jgi:hypothetical protein
MDAKELAAEMLKNLEANQAYPDAYDEAKWKRERLAEALALEDEAKGPVKDGA